MALTKRTQTLVNAVRSGSPQKVRALLAQGYEPNVKGRAQTTPLHEAVALGSFPIVKALVAAGADINKMDKHGMSPLDIAHQNNEFDEPAAFDIARYLKRKGAKPSFQLKSQQKHKQKTTATTGRALGERAMAKGVRPMRKPPPVVEPKFREETLKDVFNPESWMGKTAEMEKLWTEVPKKLQGKFDFAAALSEAKRHTMHQQFPPAKKALKK